MIAKLVGKVARLLPTLPLSGAIKLSSLIVPLSLIFEDIGAEEVTIIIIIGIMTELVVVKVIALLHSSTPRWS